MISPVKRRALEQHLPIDVHSMQLSPSPKASEDTIISYYQRIQTEPPAFPKLKVNCHLDKLEMGRLAVRLIE